MKPNTQVILPVISNIDEAKNWSTSFKSILTVGPSEQEVSWGHSNHRIFTFGDTASGIHAPTIDSVTEALEWGVEQEDLLVHCHAGMSRSTSIAWGISIMRGADPLSAFLSLKDAQPKERYGYRDFIPNKLIVKYLETILSIKTLSDIRRDHATKGWN